ncbi:hypothetical protein PanWU01x14_365620 [Parasponia andersonii]|uniref:Uncharacterized protein n=1 Tax=Parasponia andersonii TaxID=3476 RepID=A0A2P5A5Y6_PARAD|nr:hypothetical protein PanWU01x14_365620 [Parasponia andersonii]
MEIRSLGILDKSHFFQQYRFKGVLEDILQIKTSSTIRVSGHDTRVRGLLWTNALASNQNHLCVLIVASV